MRPIKLFQSSGFRIAFTFTLVFLLAASIAGATAFSIIGEELVKRHERVLTSDYETLRSTFLAGGLTDLSEAVAAHAAASRNHESVYLLLDPGSAKIAGNIDAAPSVSTPQMVPAKELGLNADFGVFHSTWRGRR